jgi:cell division initiation protein
MPIRPIDVRRKEFKNSLRGYDANQVDDFLDAVADEFERAYTDNSRMREEISSLRERLQQFEELEGSIRAALVHAEQAADDLRRTSTREAEDLRQSANREADFTIREAQARAHQMLAETSARVERIQESYEALQEAKRNFANDFRHLLKTYMDMMENMEISSAREIEASLRERLDTESIAVAREAATYEGTATEYEEEPDTEDAGATQRMEPVGTADEVPQTEPEIEEVEPSTAPEEGPPTISHEPEAQPVADEEAVIEEPAAVDEPAPVDESEEPATAEQPAPEEEPAAADVEREEPSLSQERGSQSFFDREESGTSSSEEGERENRIFRASRFLRRRE